jgi:nicotinamidase-related amidase
MSEQLSPQATLILIDIQQGFDDPYWGPRNNPDAERRAADLLAAWRRSGRPVVHIQHLSVNPASPLHPSRPGVALQMTPIDGEPVMQKSVNSAFIGTDLEGWLRERDIDQVVLAGLTTNHCVETSTRMAGNLGFNPILVEDACASFDLTGPDGQTWPAATIHAVTLANLHVEFATVMTTDELIPMLDISERVS